MHYWILADPKKLSLCVLIDRRFSRQFPIQPDYVGKSIDSIISQKVKVFWKEKDGKNEVIFTGLETNFSNKYN